MHYSVDGATDENLCIFVFMHVRTFVDVHNMNMCTFVRIFLTCLHAYKYIKRFTKRHSRAHAQATHQRLHSPARFVRKDSQISCPTVKLGLIILNFDQPPAVNWQRYFALKIPLASAVAQPQDRRNGWFVPECRVRVCTAHTAVPCKNVSQPKRCREHDRSVRACRPSNL